MKKEKNSNKRISRRDFIKQSATVGTATLAGVKQAGATQAKRRAERSATGATPTPLARTTRRGGVRTNRQAILFAIGDTLIPSTPGDPGYRDLEWYGISKEIDRRLDDLADQDLALFNTSSIGPLGKAFTQLSEKERADYLNLILKDGGFKDAGLQEKLKDVYSQTREMIFTVYYRNFPQDHWPHDANHVPLLKAGDEHQITNPSTPDIPTGWDLAGYAGPLTFEEEERRRNVFKKIRWEE